MLYSYQVSLLSGPKWQSKTGGGGDFLPLVRCWGIPNPVQNMVKGGVGVITNQKKCSHFSQQIFISEVLFLKQKVGGGKVCII